MGPPSEFARSIASASFRRISVPGRRVIQHHFHAGSARAHSRKTNVDASRPLRTMVARPKISQNEWKTTELGAFEGGHPFAAPLRAPDALRAVVVVLELRGQGRVDGAELDGVEVVVRVAAPQVRDVRLRGRARIRVHEPQNLLREHARRQGHESLVVGLEAHGLGQEFGHGAVVHGLDRPRDQLAHRGERVQVRPPLALLPHGVRGRAPRPEARVLAHGGAEALRREPRVARRARVPLLLDGDARERVAERLRREKMQHD